MNNPLDIIKKDHESLEELFVEYEGLDDEALTEKHSLCEKIRHEFVLHTEMEEALCYPQFKLALPPHEEYLLSESYVAHKNIEDLLDTIQQIEDPNSEFDSILRELISTVRHHMHIEETQILPHVQLYASPEMLGALGDDLLTFKESNLGVLP